MPLFCYAILASIPYLVTASRIVGKPKNKELLDRPGILKRYTGAFVEIYGQERYLSTNSIALED